jgi:hypothetical protein
MKVPRSNTLRPAHGAARKMRQRATRSLTITLLTSLIAVSALAFASISSAKLSERLFAHKASSSSPAVLTHATVKSQPVNPAATEPAPNEPVLAMVTTDKTDYQPGEVVIISGSGWLAGEVVSLVLHDGSKGSDTTYTATADEYGNILNKEFSTTEENVGTTFTLSATGQSSGKTASATFTDGGSMNYSPNNHVLNIQSDASPHSASFSQTVSAPRGNGNFTASLQVTGTGVTPLPAAWVSAAPDPLSYSTGSGTPTVFFPQTRTVTVTVPALTPAGTYTGQIRVNPSVIGVGQGPGTNLSVVVTSDNAPPNTLLSATTPPSNPYNGVDWTNQDVTVTLAATDAGTPASGVASTKYKLDSGPYVTYSGPFTISAEGITAITYFSTDNQGNAEPGQNFTVKIDKTAPSVTAVRDTAANANGWNNTDVDVSYTASDALSGVNTSASDATPYTLTGEGAGQSHTFTVYDNAGNSGTGTVNDINIDKTDPIVTATRTPAANSYGWNNTDVTVSVDSASDALSGIDTTSSPVVVSTEGAGQSANVSATDKAGNTGMATINDINIDKTAPLITADRSPAANANGWNNTDVTVSVSSASDALSGIASSDAPVTVTTEGANQSVTLTATDKAGNSASATVNDINIDKTAPIISASRTPAANGFGWNNTDVTASYTASDALSGLDASSPASGNHLFNTEGAGQSHTFSVTDQAGNSNSASVTNVNIDKTAPTITITTPANGGSYVFNSIVAANFSTADALSGLDASTQTSTNPQGSNINTATVGSKSFNVSVKDKAGNLASQTNNYMVVYAPVGAICPLGPGRTILPPINPDGSSVFKKGSTVPAKFRVYDANCNSIGTPGVVADFRLIQVISGTITTNVNEEVISTAADPAFRWSASDQQWIFNINTKNLSANMTYIFQVSLNDGTNILFRYGLK